MEALLSARPAEASERGRLSLGRIVGSWRVEAYLGAGRSSEVYRVVGTRFFGEGALKLLVDSSHGLDERFRREMDALRSLAVPSLPRFFDSGELDGRPYYVMEYLQPLFLPLARAEIVPFACALAKAVGELHAAGYVHADLKPGNVLRRKDGKPVLIDMGLSRRIGEAPAEGVGTMGFAAPEQLLNGETSVRADVFALGKMLRAAGGKQVSHRIRSVIRRATHADPEERYPSAEAFAAAIRGNQNVKLIVSTIAVFVAFLAAFLLCSSVGGSKGESEGAHRAVQDAPQGDDGGSQSEAEETPEARFARILADAESGDVEAQVETAESLYHGRGTPTNRAEALVWYRRAAEAGVPGAQDTLGVCLLRGWECERNAEEAVMWFQRAAEQDHPSAMNNLAFCCLNGLGTVRDAERAFFWAKAAADQGHAPSQTLVGECCRDGLGTERSLEQARFWFRRAARKGNARARMLLEAMDDDCCRKTVQRQGGGNG